MLGHTDLLQDFQYGFKYGAGIRSIFTVCNIRRRTRSTCKSGVSVLVAMSPFLRFEIPNQLPMLNFYIALVVCTAAVPPCSLSYRSY